MNHQLELIIQWTWVNKMNLNHSKSSVMWFSGSNHHSLSDLAATLIDGIPFNVLSGLTFDDQLNCRPYHVGKVCKFMPYYLYLTSKHRHVIKAN